MKRRGFVFTLDALLSLLLVTIFITGALVVESNSAVYSTYQRNQEKYLAEDTLKTLRTVSLKELVPQTVLNDWKNRRILVSGLVTEEMSPLDIAATYWATAEVYPSENLTRKAEIILGYLLNATLNGYNYELLINNYTSPYLRKVGSNYSKAYDVSPATLVMSGYAYNQTPRGYMARAYLTKVTFERFDIFGIQRVLASCFYGGGYSNQLRVTSHFRLPGDAMPMAADIRLIQRTGAQYSQFSLNGHSLSSGYHPDIGDYLQGGDNVLTAVFSPSSYWCQEMGYGSGSLMAVRYRTKTANSAIFDPARRYGELYHVESHTGIYYLNALFVPGNLTSISLHLVTEGVQNIRVYYSFGSSYYELIHKTVSTSGKVTTDITAEEIENALASYGFSLDEISRTYFSIVIALDSWWNPGTRRFEYETTYRLRVLYGDGESYIDLNYIPATVTTRYSIPLSIFKDYGDIQYSGPSSGRRYQRMSFEYVIPDVADPWYVDVWTAIQFTTYTPSSYTTLSENGQVIYHNYSDIYMIRAAYTRLNEHMMIPGQTNTYVAESSNVNQYGFREGESRAVINFFIQGYAGYGDVFPRFIREGCGGYNITYYWEGEDNPRHITAGDEPYCPVTAQELLDGRDTYAVDDALVRLFNNLGGDGTQDSPILVQLPESVKIDFASMGNIPGLFQPIQITLRVWREG